MLKKVRVVTVEIKCIIIGVLGLRYLKDIEENMSSKHMHLCIGAQKNGLDQGSQFGNYE